MSAEPLPPAGEERGDERRLSAESLDSLAELATSPEALTLLAAVHDLAKASPGFSAAVTRLLEAGTAEPGRRLRLVGRSRKVSISMPDELVAAVQRRVGRGEVSQYVAEAVARQLELDLLGELSAMLQAEHGPVAEKALAEARQSWPDAR